MMKTIVLLLVTLFVCLGNVQSFATFSCRSTQRASTVRSSPSFLIRPPSVVATTPTTALFGKKEARAQGNERKSKRERVKKVKDDVIEVEARVLESLPGAMFRCAIDGAPETQDPVLATISGRIRKSMIKILVGDAVSIELSPYDLTRGRITYRHRN
uniref:Translation initiation factor IF-1, chloroplastic n=1 Tax=Grammatophora oceanica TaxID=210454 RepID=A0A7S1YF82_9STRA|mmetsp:Transcript_43688/g.64865  ORF Transcript_43688/g.64865 Transcript_43688/m.64865 type:complete len:157 (+) Transcript_43688:81-551(+)|eukprot:CAMPEP_0194047136 /NCGR_PEP_ID=MMETSP0009_2-20130614/23582_1 /TAXON_ID=210454 /ORGANISM="Grammatophora oceanica, Strain CCMP 410" /LENGTH=156 /DNA_ID=CAMNT_0038692663 /DNA_START=63 /DNA_END=533 /DNA_ORIENTATION=-